MRGQLPVEDALRLAREVAEALAYAHERNIIHRDIKPGNIMMSRGTRWWPTSVSRGRLARSGEAITKTGLAVGTPQYMSPEQATGSGDVDGRADIYAMGCVLYEMLAGEPPFTGPTPQAIVTRSLTEAPRSLTASRVGLLAGGSMPSSGRRSPRVPPTAIPTPMPWPTRCAASANLVHSGTSASAVPAGPSPVLVWGLFGFASLITLGVFYGLVSRWGLPSWVLYLAVALLAIGAIVLTITGKLEARRRAGVATPGLASSSPGAMPPWVARWRW